jgi:hypothetical protein
MVETGSMLGRVSPGYRKEGIEADKTFFEGSNLAGTSTEGTADYRGPNLINHLAGCPALGIALAIAAGFGDDGDRTHGVRVFGRT